MDKPFKVILTLVVIVAFAGMLLTIFGTLQEDLRNTAALSGWVNTTDFNVTGGAQPTNLVGNNSGGPGNQTGTLIRYNPIASCPTVHIWYNLTDITGGDNPYWMQLQTTDYECFNSGDNSKSYIKLLLTGNLTNGTAVYGSGDGYIFNISDYTYYYLNNKEYNVSNAILGAEAGAADNWTTYYSLILLTIVFMLVSGFMIFRNRGGDTGGNGGGGVGMKNPLDYFDR